MVVLGACGGGDDPVVARVGDAEIHASRLAKFVERLPKGLRSQQQGLAAVREHLSSIVDQELLLAEVVARGIDDDIEVRRELDARVRSRLSQLYLTRRLMSSEDPSTEEVERVFREGGHDRQRLLARILVPSRAEAAQVAAQFGPDRETAASFGDVAEGYSDNDPSAGDQGELAWIGVDDLGAFRIPEHVFFSLADSLVAEPVDLGGMWLISPLPYECTVDHWVGVQTANWITEYDGDEPFAIMRWFSRTAFAVRPGAGVRHLRPDGDAGAAVHRRRGRGHDAVRRGQRCAPGRAERILVPSEQSQPADA
jgi:hypothetical protein